MSDAPTLPTVEAPQPMLQIAQRIFVWTSAVVLFSLWWFAVLRGQEQKWIAFTVMLLTLAYIFQVSSTQIVTLITGGKVMEAVAAATGVIASASAVATTALNAVNSGLGGAPAPGTTTTTTTTTPVTGAPAPQVGEVE